MLLLQIGTQTEKRLFLYLKGVCASTCAYFYLIAQTKLYDNGTTQLTTLRLYDHSHVIEYTKRKPPGVPHAAHCRAQLDRESGGRRAAKVLFTKPPWLPLFPAIALVTAPTIQCSLLR